MPIWKTLSPVADVPATRADKYRFAASVALVAPAIVFVTANILRYNLGVAGPYRALEPVLAPGGGLMDWVLGLVVILGPMTAFTLAVSPMVRFRIERRGEDLVGTLTVRWRPALFAVAIVSAIVLAVIGSYLVAENLPCVLGLKASC
jgi:hypothetical protein